MKASRQLARILPVFALAAVVAGFVLWPASPLPAADPPKKHASPPFNDDIEDPAAWGKAFPLHYELYLKSVDMSRTKHGGSDGIPQNPTHADPRTKVAQSKVDEDPGLKAIWQGYAFAADFREERG